jgi:hypothetical protein
VTPAFGPERPSASVPGIGPQAKLLISAFPVRHAENVQGARPLYHHELSGIMMERAPAMAARP